MRRTIYAALIPLIIVNFHAIADEAMDVDLSDSTNFEAFHTDKKEAVKIWESKDKVEKTYTQPETSDSKTAESTTETRANSTAQSDAGGDQSVKGKRYEIRELYSISGSNRTGYNPNTVVQALYLQMQGYCPNGWKKLDERSEPDGADAFYMYYSFECL